MTLMSVDFPAPFSPTRQCTSPRFRLERNVIERADTGVGFANIRRLEQWEDRSISVIAEIAFDSWFGTTQELEPLRCPMINATARLA
jgi:hypothetical protein